MSSSLADLLAETRQTIDALLANQESIAALEGGREFIHQGEWAIESLEAFDDEQEYLKTRLNGIRAQVECAQRHLAHWENDASKLLKQASGGEQKRLTGPDARIKR